MTGAASQCNAPVWVSCVVLVSDTPQAFRFRSSDMKFQRCNHSSFRTCHTLTQSGYGARTGWWEIKVISFTFQLGCPCVSSPNRCMFAKGWLLNVSRRKVAGFSLHRFRCVCVCVRPVFTQWECDGGPPSLYLQVASYFIQPARHIWSRPVTVNPPDTARLEHIFPTNMTQTEYNGVSVRDYPTVSSLL